MTIRHPRKQKRPPLPPKPRRPDDRPTDHRFNLSLRGF